MNDETAARGRSVLHVGCGRKTLADLPRSFLDEGWREIRLDIDPAVDPDEVGTITDMSAIATESVDALYSSHNIEHVFPHEVPEVAEEFYRVLKPGGFAVVTCPDLEAVAAALLEKGLCAPLYQSEQGPVTALDIIYGHIPAVKSGRTYMAHKTGFTFALLDEVLRTSGFPHVGLVRRPPEFDLWAVAAKTSDASLDMTELFDRYTFVRVR